MELHYLTQGISEVYCMLSCIILQPVESWARVAKKRRSHCFNNKIIRIKVFIKCKILSIATILSLRCTHTHTHSHTHAHHTHTHACTPHTRMHTTLTHARTHTSIFTIQNLIYTQLKQTTNRDSRQRKLAVQNGNHGRYVVLNCFQFSQNLTPTSKLTCLFQTVLLPHNSTGYQ